MALISRCHQRLKEAHKE